MLVKHAVDLLQAPAQRAHQMPVQAGIDITTARAHHHALQWCHAHAGIEALAVDDGAGRAAIAQMRHQPAAGLHGQAGELRRTPAHITMAAAMKAIAAHALLAVQGFRHGIAIGMRRHALVKGGIEHGHLG